MNLRYLVERESKAGLLGPITQPCEGAWEGAFLNGSLRGQIGWFITLDEIPTEVDPIHSGGTSGCAHATNDAGRKRSAIAAR